MSHTFKVKALIADNQKTQIIKVSSLSALLTELETWCEAPRKALVIKRGFPPKEISVNYNSDSLDDFKSNENLLVTVEMSRLPKQEDPTQSQVDQAKAQLRPDNKVCPLA